MKRENDTWSSKSSEHHVSFDMYYFTCSNRNIHSSDIDIIIPWWGVDKEKQAWELIVNILLPPERKKKGFKIKNNFIYKLCVMHTLFCHF